MSIEIGAVFGLNHVWREQSEKWHDDCVGAKKKQGEAVMCWGMVMWGWKGPFFVWAAETPEEREHATQEIARLNESSVEEEERLNTEWRNSEEWKLLREQELRQARQAQAEAKAAGKTVKTTQSWRGKKYKIKKIKRGEGRGVDAWRYVHQLCVPVLWPTCREQLLVNPSFILMEDNAPAHDAGFTNREREKVGIAKVDWPPNSPDFNPIERIWWLMNNRILRRRGCERIRTPAAMAEVLREEWARITVDEINREISKLPKIMKQCIQQAGGNRYEA